VESALDIPAIVAVQSQHIHQIRYGIREFHYTGIQIGMQRLPELHILYGELTACSAAAGNTFPCLVVKGDANFRLSCPN
jgi:hypothetical protein